LPVFGTKPTYKKYDLEFSAFSTKEINISGKFVVFGASSQLFLQDEKDLFSDFVSNHKSVYIENDVGSFVTIGSYSAVNVTFSIMLIPDECKYFVSGNTEFSSYDSSILCNHTEPTCFFSSL